MFSMFANKSRVRNRQSWFGQCSPQKHTALLFHSGFSLTQWRSQGGGAKGTPPPPKLGSQENSWLRRWAKYTKLCMVSQPNILNNCYELSGGYAPPEPPTRGSAPGPRWGTSVPQTPCAPTSKSWLRHCLDLTGGYAPYWGLCSQTPLQACTLR